MLEGVRITPCIVLFLTQFPLNTSSMSASKTFRLVLIKPSRYDDNGYVVQWVRSIIPSNTLATLYGLALDCASRKVLGDDVEIVIDAYDEPNTIIPLKKIIRDIQRADAGMVGLVGVQSNQFPRSVDIARPLREAGIPVVIGGFHVSGCLSMLPDMQVDIQKAMDMGIAIYAGEAEGRFDMVLRDVWEGKLNPLYNYLDDLPELAGAVIPFLPKFCPRNTLTRPLRDWGVWMQDGGVPFNVVFAPSSMSKVKSHGAERRMMSKVLFGRTLPKGSIDFLSRMMTLPAIKIGRRSSIG